MIYQPVDSKAVGTGLEPSRAGEGVHGQIFVPRSGWWMLLNVIIRAAKRRNGLGAARQARSAGAIG